MWLLLWSEPQRSTLHIQNMLVICKEEPAECWWSYLQRFVLGCAYGCMRRFKLVSICYVPLVTRYHYPLSQNKYFSSQKKANTSDDWSLKFQLNNRLTRTVYIEWNWRHCRERNWLWLWITVEWIWRLCWESNWLGLFKIEWIRSSILTHNGVSNRRGSMVL